MHKFRASWSVLSQWASGDWQTAVEMYFKLKELDNKYIRFGREQHEKWEAEIKKTGKMPQVFGSKPLKAPKTELKIEKQLSDWLEFVGVIDLYDDGVIYDWKTGSTPATAGNDQIRLYHLLMPTARRGEIHHWNQYTDSVETSIVHLTEDSMDWAINYLLTVGGEMHQYLVENKLYERFSREKN